MPDVLNLGPKSFPIKFAYGNAARLIVRLTPSSGTIDISGDTFVARIVRRDGVYRDATVIVSENTVSMLWTHLQCIDLGLGRHKWYLERTLASDGEPSDMLAGPARIYRRA